MSRTHAAVTILAAAAGLALSLCGLWEWSAHRGLVPPPPAVPAPDPNPAPTPSPPAKPVVRIVVIGASWCKPCRDLHAELDAHGDVLTAAGLTLAVLTDDRAAVRKYSVQGFPTIILERDGRELARREGYASAEELAAWAKKAAAP